MEAEKNLKKCGICGGEIEGCFLDIKLTVCCADCCKKAWTNEGFYCVSNTHATALYNCQPEDMDRLDSRRNWSSFAGGIYSVRLYLYGEVEYLGRRRIEEERKNLDEEYERRIRISMTEDAEKDEHNIEMEKKKQAEEHERRIEVFIKQQAEEYERRIEMEKKKQAEEHELTTKMEKTVAAYKRRIEISINKDAEEDACRLAIEKKQAEKDEKGRQVLIKRKHNLLKRLRITACEFAEEKDRVLWYCLLGDYLKRQKPRTKLRDIQKGYAAMTRVRKILQIFPRAHPGAAVDFCVACPDAGPVEFQEFQNKIQKVFRIEGHRILGSLAPKDRECLQKTPLNEYYDEFQAAKRGVTASRFTCNNCQNAFVRS